VANESPFGPADNWYHATSAATGQTVFTLTKGEGLQINQVIVYVHDANETLPAWGAGGGSDESVHTLSTVFRNTVNGASIGAASTSSFNALPIPEPSSMLYVGVALVGVTFLRRRR
jgi:hypothetical protein